MPQLSLSPLPPVEALAFFRAKGFAGELQRFDWRDLWQEEHAKAFVVAKGLKLDILATIREGLDKALAEGRTFEQFKQELTPLLQQKGWWGKAEQVDPLTGEIRQVQLGSPRRLRTIFDTNLRTAHAAGRWAQIQRNKTTRPYLRYSAVQDGRTRPLHRSWHGTILPVTHNFWKTHYPPNGWHCRCTVIPLSARDLARRGWKVSPDPAVSKRRWWHSRREVFLEVSEGIDPGFDYNVGQAWLRGVTPSPAPGSPLLKSWQAFQAAPPAQSLPALAPPGASPLPPLPAARTSPVGLLPEGLTSAAYLKEFLQAFDAPPAGRVYTDVAGERLAIGPALFLTASGHQMKLDRFGRGPDILLLAETIKSPDEIWLDWENLKEGGERLRRRYLARWVLEVDGLQVPGLVVFEEGKDSWDGVTAFSPKPDKTQEVQDRYLEKQRKGTLIFRR